MKSIFRRLVLCLLVLCLFSSLGAQQTGEIRGSVTDEQGSALPGVTITAKGSKLQGARTALSDPRGEFRLPLLPVGEYSLTFELASFERLVLTNSIVQLGFTSSIAVVLKASAVSEEVTVIAENPLIDKTKADNSFRLKGDALTQVPAPARSIAEIVSLTPGVTGVRASSINGGATAAAGLGFETGLPSFRGEGEEGNNWLVDGLSQRGVNSNDPAVVINYDAWDEVEIVSDGYAPKAGQALGGFVNIVTKSGGNEFHGEVGALLRGAFLRAGMQEQLSAASVPATSRHQYFGNLGGPIVRDKLWFFISDNFHRRVDDTQEQAIGWLTFPAGSQRVNTNNVFGKLTFTPRNNHTFSMSTVLDNFISQSGGIGLPEAYYRSNYSTSSYRLNYRGILSQNTLLTAAWGQFSRNSGNEPLSGDLGPPEYFWMDIGQSTNNYWGDYEGIERRTDFALDLTHYLDFGAWGSHELGIGFIYYNSSNEIRSQWSGQDFDLWPGNGFDNGAKLEWEAPGRPFGIIEYGPGEGQNSTRGYGFYVNDSLMMGRFSLMLGLRAETQTTFTDMKEEIWNWGLGDFLSPRVSLAVDLIGDGKNVLKLGYGRFVTPQTASVLSVFNTHMAWSFRTYDWIGSVDPTEGQLHDPLNWLFMYEQSAEAQALVVDPDLEPNKATRYLLEFDRQIGANWAFRIRGIFSFAKNMTDIIAVYNAESEAKLDLIYTNFELKKRDYRALEAEIQGKVSDKWMIHASYTWSRAKGTNPGQFERSDWISGWGSALELSDFGLHPFIPEGDPDKASLDYLYGGLGGLGNGDEGWYGYLPYSVDHLAKLLTVYHAPQGISISAVAEFLSGYHWEMKGYSPAMGYYTTFPEGRGGRTTPSHMYMDLAVDKEFILTKGLRLGIGINMYNLFNSQRPVSFVKEDNDLFGQVWARQLPRWTQVKATLIF